MLKVIASRKKETFRGDEVSSEDESGFEVGLEGVLQSGVRIYAKRKGGCKKNEAL
jgi:hypothetical protein